MSTTATTAPVVARIVTDDPGGAQTTRPTQRTFHRSPTTSSRGRAQATTRSERVRRRISTLFIALFVAFVATSGVNGGTQPASAIDLNPVDDVIDKMKDLFCFGTAEDAPTPNASNSDVALLGARAPFDAPFTNKNVTAYEEYGNSGLFWSQYRPKDEKDSADGRKGCFTTKYDSIIPNQIANQTFSLTRTMTGMTIGIYMWATDGNLLDSFTKPMNCVLNGCNGGQGLKDTLFLNYLAPIVMLGALWGAWNGLVKKRTTETAQGGLWMVGATAFALIFLANPGIVAERSNDFVNSMTTTITNGVTSASSSAIEKDDPCYLPESEKNAGNRSAACSMWKAMSLTPWSAGQFGVPLGTELKGDKEVNVGNRKFRDIRIAQIEAQTISATELASGKSYADLNKSDNDIWYSVREDVRDGIGSGNNQASFGMWSGDQAGERVNIAFAALFAAIALGLLVVVISFATVVFALAMILLIMMAPLFLLVGIHPGFGRGIALKWLELLLGTILKRIVLATLLAILIGMYQVILETPMPWFSQIGLILALGIGAFTFRKPMLETLNVINLGGSRTGMESGIGREGKKVAGAATGVGAGAVAAGAAGGGIGAVVAGGFRGGVSGSRSGSPVRAATMGAGAGRRAGSRDAAAKRAQEAREAKDLEKQAKDLERRLAQDPDDDDLRAEAESWNKKRKNKNTKVDIPPRPQGSGSGGRRQSPDLDEALDDEAQRTNRRTNGGAGPRPSGPGSTGPTSAPADPNGGGGVPVNPPNGQPTAGPRPQGSAGGGIPTQPPVAPVPAPTGTTPPATAPTPTNGTGSGAVPRPQG